LTTGQEQMRPITDRHLDVKWLNYTVYRAKKTIASHMEATTGS